MSEQPVTYVELRSHIPAEQKRKRRPQHTRITGNSVPTYCDDNFTELSFYTYNWSEVPEQEVTYSELKFQTSSVQQRQQTPTSAESKDCPPALWLITVILGFLCLVLLATSVALGAMFHKASHQVRKMDEQLNQEKKNFSHNFSQLNETLKNCTQQTDDLRAQQANFTKAENGRGDKCSSCPEGWIQHRGQCYHFTKERRTWPKSKDYCSSQGSRLLQIENKDEMNFINGLACFHWIGLCREGPATSWVWEDGTTHSTDMFQVRRQDPGEACAVLNAGEAVSYACTRQYRCICKKTAAQLKTAE